MAIMWTSNENPMKSMKIQGNPMDIYVNCNEIVCSSNGNTMKIKRNQLKSYENRMKPNGSALKSNEN